MTSISFGFVRPVADAGTLTGGAGRCHVTLSTLFTGIAHLESSTTKEHAC